jgi:hypothetical protein
MQKPPRTYVERLRDTPRVATGLRLAEGRLIRPETPPKRSDAPLQSMPTSMRSSRWSKAVPPPSLDGICDDVLGRMIDCAWKAVLDRYRLACTLSLVSKSLLASMVAPSASLLEAASRDLLARGRRQTSDPASDPRVGRTSPPPLASPTAPQKEPPSGILLDFSHMRLSTLECRLLALAMANGLLSRVESLWLQDNLIHASGVRWLAHGLRVLPTGCGPRSISLGHNPVHSALTDKSEGRRRAWRAARRAVDKLLDAAALRRVHLRLNS